MPHEVLIACNVQLEDIHAGKDSEALRAALFAVRERARSHLETLRDGIRGIDRRIAPALLPVSLVTPWLSQMERTDYRPFETLVTLSPFRRLTILGHAAWKARRASRR
jgi:phytoene synthase